MSFKGENRQYDHAVSWSMFWQYMAVFSIIVGVCHFNSMILMPRLFKRKRYILYVVSLILLIIIGGVSAVGLRDVFLNLGAETQIEWGYKRNEYTSYFLHIVLSEFLLLLLTSFFYIMQEFINLQDTTIRLKEIEKENTQAQLQELKAQINPHFLFNTLNNLYSHSLEQSPKTPDMILKISDLMSYILYECKEDKVPLNNELSFIRNYVELEKLRYEDQIDIDFTITGNDTDIKIAPLLFIPFIENAFKHGGNTGGNHIFVKIDIEVKSNSISFYICNSAGETDNNNTSKGIGIKNVKKRLELLYSKAYSLELADKDNMFYVKLTLFENGN